MRLPGHKPLGTDDDGEPALVAVRVALPEAPLLFCASSRAVTVVSALAAGALKASSRADIPAAMALRLRVDIASPSLGASPRRRT
jgi:hypothetical protein